MRWFLHAVVSEAARDFKMTNSLYAIKSAGRSRLRAVFLAALGVCWLPHIFWGTPVAAQGSPSKDLSQGASKCQDDIVESDGYLIRTVRIKARYLPLTFELPGPGTPYSPEKVTELVEFVYKALKLEGMREDVDGTTEHELLNTVAVGKGEMEEQASPGKVLGFKSIFSCVRKVEAKTCQTTLGPDKQKCVDITIVAISVRLDTSSPWNSLLNTARSNQPTAFSQVPGWLRAFKPIPGMDYDRRFGLAETLALSTNLFALRKNLNREPLSAGNTRLELTAQGRKSQNEPFYSGQAQLTLARRLGEVAEQATLEGGFSANHHPLGTGDYLQNTAVAGGSLRFRPQTGPIGSLKVGVRYQWSSNRFSKIDGTPGEFTSAQALQTRLISDGKLWGGVARMALWAEVVSPQRINETYRRLAGTLGYAREFSVKPNQTVGVEAIFGAGHIWGEAPQYAHFYGGNWAGNFLHEPIDSSLMATLPDGPLLRSFGRNQAITRATDGGDSYLHFNLNVSLPIPRWSSPLIPDICIDGVRKDPNGKVVLDEDGFPIMECRPLKTVIKSQGETSKRSLRKILMKEEGLSDTKATAKAERELKGVNSILAFIADQANLYSIKPLLMFDAAQLKAPGLSNSHTRYAIGGGLQFTIVIARFEAGYLRTLHRLPGDNRGNIVMRLVFSNLF